MSQDLSRIARNFDAVLAQADGPMWVVTAVAGDQRAGCLVGFASQVSIEPRRFLVCVSKVNHTYRIAEAARHLAVHLLGADATALAELFGVETGSEIDKFEHCEWQQGPHRLPILAGAAGWFTGEIEQTADFGDHVGFVLSPTAAEPATTTSLRFHAVADLTPGHPA
ncbi:flavin reductase family protein [Nocardia sp. NPDC056000]|uniref:flavin reductase family protein n=1 Tax=Nocardia sp. NPDC056000 TaxID=3345674 RepID=UPI0035DD9EA0